MPSLFARIRRAVGRFLGGGPEGAAGLASISTVPVSVRARTSDDADMRLLLDVRVEGATLPLHDLDRLVLALTVPATRRTVAKHDLAGLQVDLAPELDEVGASVRAGLAEVGATLLDVELVAAEHLLSSPSADPANGPE